MNSPSIGRVILVCVIFLYALTWIAGGGSVYRSRPENNPVCIPVLPFVLYSCDRSRLAGERAIYIWYVAGVWRIEVLSTWIA